jgi:hypothetical protein
MRVLVKGAGPRLRAAFINLSVCGYGVSVDASKSMSGNVIGLVRGTICASAGMGYPYPSLVQETQFDV